MIRKRLQPKFTPERVAELLSYDPNTQQFRWRMSGHGRTRNAIAAPKSLAIPIDGVHRNKTVLAQMLGHEMFKRHVVSKLGHVSALLDRAIRVTPPKPKPPLVLTKSERELASRFKTMGIPKKNIEQHIRGLRDVEHKKNYWRPTQRDTEQEEDHAEV